MIGAFGRCVRRALVLEYLARWIETNDPVYAMPPGMTLEEIEVTTDLVERRDARANGVCSHCHAVCADCAVPRCVRGSPMRAQRAPRRRGSER